MTQTTIPMSPGDDVHLTLLMAPQSLNLVTGQDREHLLAFGRAAFEAGKAIAEQGKCLHQIAEPAAYPHLPHSIADVVDFMDGRGVNVDFSHPAPAGGTSLYTAAQMRAYVDADRAQRAAPPQATDHPDDAAVDALAALMKAKLAKQRAKGYGGWNDKALCSQQRLSDMLRTHVDKGDPVDVANFCAFLVARGEGIAAAPQAVQPAVPEGWMLVPMNGTEEMARAFRAESTPALFYMTTIQCADFQERYRAMLNAAPVAPAHPAEGVPAQSAYAVEDDVFAGYLDGQVSRFSVRRADGSHLAWVVAERHVDDGEAIAREIVAALNTTHPTQQGLDRQQIDPLRQMIAQHQAHLEQNQHAYFELAYTRSTGWMVWITDKPAFRESVLANPDRKVLWQGQGDTPDEACENAAIAAQAKQGEHAND